MRAHYLQHVAFEGLGQIETWLDRQGYQVTGTHLYRDEQLPDAQALEEIDLLIVMGGPMSVNDEGQLPWLAAEKAFIRQAVTADKQVLGICLGAQLIASALGQAVYPHVEREIGWFAIQGNTHHNGAAFHFPEQVTVLHWHGETFDLPHGAVPLASSTACANQAFQLGRSVIGLQFHLEATRALLADFVEADGESLQPADFVQPADAIVGVADPVLEQTSALLYDLLDYLTREETIT
ncbi:MAG: gamma-glutamyl-gamma-aminobutyrate hydrolase family protein [Halopseudomonas sp.]|uniref:type 1 glutamine amidotransferase n=1 Tax=Halopseudomonas sp. TaxID=2901191 RepID=UPI00300325FB